MSGSLSDERQNEALIKKTIETFGRIDVLINNAGIRSKTPFGSEDFMQEFDETIAINVRGLLHLTHLAAHYLIQSKGSVINVGSTASFVTRESSLGYCVSKAAVSKITKCLAAELGLRGVRVNEVCPGLTETGLLDTLGLDSEQKAALLEINKKKELCSVNTAEEVARVIVFLASNVQCPTTSGLSYVIDSGSIVKPADV